MNINVQSAPEKESEIIASIGNFNGLFQAKKIYHQEQAQIRGKSGRIRVRRERGRNAQRWSHTQTTKHKQAAGATDVTNDERTISIPSQAYGMFLSVAGEYQRKTRFIFPLGTIELVNEHSRLTIETKQAIFEVDVFYKEDGTPSEWCKIDFEHGVLQEELKAMNINGGEFEITLPISTLPFMPVKAFIVTPQMLPAQKKLRDHLYEKEWNRIVNVQEVLNQFCTSNTDETTDPPTPENEAA